MSKILYHERKSTRTKQGPQYNPITDYVEVAVRYWCAQGMEADIVLSWRVMVDGEIVVDCRSAEDPGDKPDADFIRKGIATFDELLEAHPNKDRLAPEPGPDELPF